MRRGVKQCWNALSMGHSPCKICVLALLLVAGMWVYILDSPFRRAGRWWRDSDALTPWVDPGPYHVSYPRNYHFIVDEPDKCQDRNPFLVLMVPVTPKNRAARDAIRRTWGSESLVQGKAVTVLFLLGLPGGADAEKQQERVRLESQEHRDLLQSNFLDTYRNLTIKTMVMLEWLASRCPRASYAAKVDSDILLSVENLVKLLLARDTPRQNYISGMVWWHNEVLRDPLSKYFLPYHVYPAPEYPPYPLGMCYIISMDLPEKILGVSRQIRPIFIEDAYIGMCVQRLGFLPTNPPSITSFIVNPPVMYSRCFYASLVAVMTRHPTELQAFWEDIHRPGPPC